MFLYIPSPVTGYSSLQGDVVPVLSPLSKDFRTMTMNTDATGFWEEIQQGNKVVCSVLQVWNCLYSLIISVFVAPAALYPRISWVQTMASRSEGT